MIHYKKTQRVRCKVCRKLHLEIWAFTWIEDGEEQATPVLVCEPRRGCGTFFDPDQYGLTDKDLQAGDW